MERPVMDPLFLKEEPWAEKKVHKRFAIPWHLIWRVLRRVLRAICWCLIQLLRTPWRRKSVARARNWGDLAGRILRGLLYRLAFAPTLIALTAAALVFSGTHPLPAPAASNPMSRGVYYDSVSFSSDDGTPLQGWLVPAVDARRVLEQRDRTLRSRHPALVLAHDFGKSPSQLLPMLQPLHEDGFEVLVVGLRGVGSILPAGQTFGLNESKDLAAAVRYLRARASVDGKRVGLLGVGTGANAALLAAERDKTLTTLILADPEEESRDLLARRVGPDHWPLRWMQPLCRWGFEIGYRVDAGEIDLTNYQKAMDAPGTFCAVGATAPDGTLSPEFVRLAADFCRARLKTDAMADASGPQNMASAE